MTTNLTPQSRSCGGCTACCQALAVFPLQKPTGIKCEHVTPTGCGIYNNRQDPKYVDCHAFHCLWLQGWATEADRPDILGAVPMCKNDPDDRGHKRLQLAELFPGSSNKPRVKELIAQSLLGGQAVAITNAVYVITHRPNGDSWQFEIDTSEPLRARVNRSIPPIPLTIHGRPAPTTTH
jgi:hypothetical protein